MLRRRLLPVLALPMALASFAAANSAEVPAGADESTCEMVTDTSGTCRVQAWLSCDNATGGRVSFYSTATPNAQLTLDEPTGSAQAGDFCGEPENGAYEGSNPDNIHVFSFEGNIEGNLQNLTVNLYDLALGASRAGGDITLKVRVTIDGKSPAGNMTGGVTGDTASPAIFDVVVTPVDGNSNATQQYTFTLAGLDQVLGDKLMREGFGTKAHHIKITIDGPANGAHIYAWGAQDIPSGIILNPTADDTLGTVVEFEAAA